jgi:hypothetical protein
LQHHLAVFNNPQRDSAQVDTQVTREASHKGEILLVGAGF